jgi:N-carbamoylputrescine amidase
MLAALVVNPVTADREANLRTVVSLIHEAASKCSNLVLLGEMAVTGMVNNDDPAHDLPLGESVPGPITGQMAGVAAKLSIWLGFGLLERDGSRLYDTALLLSPTGDIRLKYRRMNPQWHGARADPTVYCQSVELRKVKTDFGSVAFMICGDLWEDEWRGRMREVQPDWVLYLYARCFPGHGRDPLKWEQDELPEYQRRVAEIGVPVLATSYVCTEAFSEEADAFGGAMVLDREGKILKSLPLDRIGILYFDSKDILRDRRPSIVGSGPHERAARGC